MMPIMARSQSHDENSPWFARGYAKKHLMKKSAAFMTMVGDQTPQRKARGTYGGPTKKRKKKKKGGMKKKNNMSKNGGYANPLLPAQAQLLLNPSMISPHMYQMYNLQQMGRLAVQQNGFGAPHDPLTRPGTNNGAFANKGGVMTIEVTPPPLPTLTVEKRQKQVHLGKSTLGYQNYRKAIPRTERSEDMPTTPLACDPISKRHFDRKLKAWRRALHDYDHFFPEMPPQVPAE